jgi:hypothetical protein
VSDGGTPLFEGSVLWTQVLSVLGLGSFSGATGLNFVQEMELGTGATATFAVQNGQAGLIVRVDM